MTIQGTMGYCEGDVKSATYSPTQYNEFIHDAESLGYTTDVSPVRGLAWAYDNQGLITGDWSSKHGGSLAWS